MGMVALRGIPDDYDEWDALGARGWAWNDVLPYFRKLENDLDFAGELHGRDGPTPIRRTPYDAWTPLARGAQRIRREPPASLRRRHERRLPRRLLRAADEQYAAKPRLGGDLLSRCRDAPARRT